MHEIGLIKKGEIVISIALLCGGNSKRFGSDKTFHMIGNKTILETVYQKFKTQSDDVFLQCSNNNHNKNNNPIKLVNENVETYNDLLIDKGPLGGIYSALKHAKHHGVFIVASDLPCIDKNILTELLAFQSYTLVVPKWDNGFVEPLCALYSKELLPLIENQIINNDLKINNLFKLVEGNSNPDLKIKYVNINECIQTGKIDSQCFKNINSLEDL